MQSANCSYVAQGSFNGQLGQPGIQTSNLLIAGQPTLPPERLTTLITVKKS